MDNNPTTAGANGPRLPICGFCKSDPLIFNVVDGLMQGGEVVLRQMFCANCLAMIAVFPIAMMQSKPEEKPLIQPPGGRIDA